MAFIIFFFLLFLKKFEKVEKTGIISTKFSLRCTPSVILDLPHNSSGYCGVFANRSQIVQIYKLGIIVLATLTEVSWVVTKSHHAHGKWFTFSLSQDQTPSTSLDHPQYKLKMGIVFVLNIEMTFFLLQTWKFEASLMPASGIEVSNRQKTILDREGSAIKSHEINADKWNKNWLVDRDTYI